MTGRRPHHKSKLGCTECKQRRVKCDEGRPGCQNCRKRGAECSFRTFDPVPKSSSIVTSPSGKILPRVHVFEYKSETSSLPQQIKDFMDACTSQDLLAKSAPATQLHCKDVLKHFATDTIPSYSAGLACQAAWYKTLTYLAGKHSFLTHGMLSTALLHISHLSSTSEQLRISYQKMAATEMNLAMAQYRIEIGKITTENADALFAFSTLLTIYVLSTSATECALTLNTFRTVENKYNDSTKLTSSMVGTICRVFRSVRGVLVILVPCWDHLQSGPLQPVVQRDWWPAAVPETEEEVSNDEKLRQVEKIWSRPERAYDYSFDTLRIALKSLRESFALVSKLERLGWTSKGNGEKGFDWTSIIHWPVQLPLDFLLLLEQRHVEAWVIVAHFAMLTDKPETLRGSTVYPRTS